MAKSKFGEEQLVKLGWQKGKGLGKNLNGQVHHVSISKRIEGQGLGAETKSTWDDAWWDDIYNQALEKVQVTSRPKEDNSSQQNSLTIQFKDQDHQESIQTVRDFNEESFQKEKDSLVIMGSDSLYSRFSQSATPSSRTEDSSEKKVETNIDSSQSSPSALKTKKSSKKRKKMKS